MVTVPKRPWPAHFRASLMAASLASAPELQKNTWPPALLPSPTSRSMSSATCQACSVANSDETWTSVEAWRARASATSGWAWPSDTTAKPPRKSR